MSATLHLGDLAPDFTLPDTDGNAVALAVEAPATVVVFTCNHCPYALAWHDRLIDAARDYAGQGVRFLFINPNDGVSHPGDSYEAMQKRVAGEDWPAPYLHDADQDVAHAYAAATTPHVYLLDAGRTLVYEGAPDGDHRDPAQNAVWLRAALDDVLAGRPVAQPETKPVGCSVKYRS